MPVSIDDLRALALDRLNGAPDGEPLDGLARSLVALGTAAAVTSLDPDAIAAAVDAAIAAGATPDQIEETIALVSGLGVHSLMATAQLVLRARGEASDSPLDPERRALWDRHVADDPFWTAFQDHVPGFLPALIRISPATFRAFFDYCAVPWQRGAVRARVKELAAMACDATPAHRFLPGFALHLGNAIHLGAGRLAVLGALDIAARCPPHTGFGRMPT